MPEAKPAAGSEPQPAGEPVALYYTGDASGEPHINGVPARDLTNADLERLAFVESKRTGKEAKADKISERLAATPLYRKTAPKES